MNEIKIGEYFLQKDKISKIDLDRALEAQKTLGGYLGQILIKLGIVSEEDLCVALSDQMSIPLIRQSKFIANRPSGFEVSNEFLVANSIVPYECVENGRSCLKYAAAEPQSIVLSRSLEFYLSEKPVISFGLSTEIQSTLHNWIVYGSAEKQVDNDISESVDEFIDHLRDLASEAPIVQRVNQIFSNAVSINASDIHIETYEDNAVVRYRVDGEMVVADKIDRSEIAAVVSRIKILSQMDIAERRIPQDGRTKIRLHGKELDTRVSTLPTMYGESVVMRLLEKNYNLLSLDGLNFDNDILMDLKGLIKRPHGIILVTGPTGSGKSTTLYASLQELNGEGLKILTVEDPVEYRLMWLNQVQVQPQIGLTFASALRSFLRQDPDVIMIGEMRDGETANIAVQSALTGHLVVSTLHTNSSLGAIARLINMGVEPYLIAASVIGVLAQRLVRQLCGDCKVLANAEEAVVSSRSLGVGVQASDRIYRPIGCASCRGTGYRGRLAIHELLQITDRFKLDMIHKGASIDTDSATYSNGILLSDGIRKFKLGLTTAEEILRVSADND